MTNMEKELNKELEFWGDDRGLCLKCRHKLEVSEKLGYSARTDQDYNDCPYAADMMYADYAHEASKYEYMTPETIIGDGNNREYQINGVTVFKTVDNGMGYDIVKCPYFEARTLPIKSQYEVCMNKMIEYTDSLIKRGVSPDCAADNAGYVLYAALGGQARQEHKTINLGGKEE